MNRKTLLLVSLIVLALLVPLGAMALTLRQQADTNVPGQMTYQGYLTNAQGTPVAGEADLEFGIYDQESGGALKWTETHTNVTVTDGYFSANLGNTTPLTSGVFEDPERWLQVSVDGAPLSRQPIAAAPYAFQAAAVPWTGIDDIPAGFADGVDNDTLYTNAQAVAAVEAAGTLDITATHAIPAERRPMIGCRVIATQTQNIARNNLIPLEYQVEIVDTANCWAPENDNPSRLIAPASGYYMAGGAVAFNANEIITNSRVTILIRHKVPGAPDGIFIQGNETQVFANKALNLSVSTGMFYMSKGDYIEVILYQDSPNPIDTYMPDDPFAWQHANNGWLLRID